MDTTESPIIDPSTGKGFQKPDKTELARHITRATVTGVRQSSPGYSVASSLTPERLASVLRNAVEGRCGGLPGPGRGNGRARPPLFHPAAHP